MLNNRIVSVAILMWMQQNKVNIMFGEALESTKKTLPLTNR